MLLTLPLGAQAASITIRIEFAYIASPGSYAYNILADLEAGAQLGALDLVTAGVTSMTPNAANPAISLLDSGFQPNVFGDDRGALSINNTALGVAIASGPTTGEILGTLFSPYWNFGEPVFAPFPLGVFSDPAYFGGAVYDETLVPVADAVVIQIANGGYVFPPSWEHRSEEHTSELQSPI